MNERRNQQQSGQRQQGQNPPRQAQQSQGGVSGLGDSDRARGMGQQGAGQEFPQDSVRGSQQGGPSGSRQLHQFDSQGRGQQSGGSGTTSRFADQIREHMEVVDDMGKHCGTVDHVDGDRIKLARSDSKDGQHHYVSMSQVAGIEGNKVRLRERGDNDFGMESR